MKVFVTGGAGFIGSHLCARLLKAGHSVTAYDNLSLGRLSFISELQENTKFTFVQNDLLDDPQLSSRLMGFDLVYHLASNSDISAGSQRPELDLAQNVVATNNLLEGMRTAKVKKLVFASSSAVYGEALTFPTPETYGPLVPISSYGAGKISAEAFIGSTAHLAGIQSWIFRFPNVVGANLTHGAIYDFIGRLRMDPTSLVVLGNGRQKKSFLHVSECIDGMFHGIKMADSPVNIFNLAGIGVTEISVIAEEVVKQMNLSATVRYGQAERGWRGDVPYTCMDGTKLKAAGWVAKIESTDAVRRSIREELQCTHRP